MKTITVWFITVLLLTSAMLAQQSPDIKAAGMNLLGALSGDMEKFDRGMKSLDELIAKYPNDPNVKVLHGNGLFAQSGIAFQKGDVQNALKLWQSSGDEMAEAVRLAPDNLFVRARRGVVYISASRSPMPAEMARPILKLAVEDFETVLQIREKEKTLAERSIHQRGELLTGIADGWNRLGDTEKARVYFERIARDLKGTIYGEKAKAWLDGKPETKAVEYFACSGCHVE